MFDVSNQLTKWSSNDQQPVTVRAQLGVNHNWIVIHWRWFESGPAKSAKENEGFSVNVTVRFWWLMMIHPSWNWCGISWRTKGFVESAYDAAQAFDVLVHTPIDCIILDAMMPGQSGFELCRQIRTQSEIPILFLRYRRHSRRLSNPISWKLESTMWFPWFLVRKGENVDNFVLYFKEIYKAPLPYVGEKGANLGELTKAGFPVLQGFCVTTSAYQVFVQASNEMKNFFNQLDNINADNLDEILGNLVLSVIKNIGPICLHGIASKMLNGVPVATS